MADTCGNIIFPQLCWRLLKNLESFGSSDFGDTSLADLRGGEGSPWVQIVSISCSFWENLGKLYVGAHFPEGWRPHLEEILDARLHIFLTSDENTSIVPSVAFVKVQVQLMYTLVVDDGMHQRILLLNIGDNFQISMFLCILFA